MRTRLLIAMNCRRYPGLRGWPLQAPWPKAEELAAQSPPPWPCFTPAVAEELLWAALWVCKRRDLALRRMVVSRTACLMTVHLGAASLSNWGLTQWLGGIPHIARRRARRRGAWPLGEPLLSLRFVMTYGEYENLSQADIERAMTSMQPHAIFGWTWHSGVA
ncbi:MAG TPA: hypothetical protein VK157_14670 [Phycisphaerales bacterium]|nr:hypothetical protein [Phycisphaerales bacterium]